MLNDSLYRAALIIIGNEILSGRTHDTNTPWIAERLTRYGILLAEVRVIPDIEDVIINTVRDVKGRFDYVFTTGGIGPTHDDITSESMAKAFGKSWDRNPQAYQMLVDYYGAEQVTPARAKMAMIPATATLIPNPVTGAPGFGIENVFVMAGVPRIMQAMFDHVIGQIKIGAPVLSSTVTCGLHESLIADDLGKLQKEFPDVDVGSYPHYRGGILGLSLVVRATDQALLETVTNRMIALIRQYGGEPRAVSMKTKEEPS
jgi:molybdenum cofactor synthesis domain-containing protein